MASAVGREEKQEEAPDAQLITSGGRVIPVHVRILATASPVLEKALFQRRRKRGISDRSIPSLRISGVPCGAVSAFVRYLYESRCTSEEMDRYAMHLLALAHAYRLPRLKRACVGSLSQRLDAESVIDVMKLARLCDAPRLHVRCIKFLSKNFSSVEQTEGWRFLQSNDPLLELDILQALHDIHLREKRRERNKKTQSVYLELSEAMDCLQHICTEGCTEVGPSDGGNPSENKGPCKMFETCRGLQRLIRHFATCERKKMAGPGGGCKQCKRMWQLLRLHASLCDAPEPCRVPLCDQLKRRASAGTKEEDDEDDARWRLLVRKVVSAKVVSVLTRREKM